MKDLTLLIAHPDDEALFLWPFLERARRIVCCVSDEHNPERQWCKARGQALAEIAALIGAEVVNLGGNSEFYRLPTRDGTLHRFAARIVAEIAGQQVATHNPWGEYGNLDHIICHQMALLAKHQHGGARVWCTDITPADANWLPVSARCDSGYPQIMDRQLFDRCKEIYERRGCWTWSWEPVATCRTFSC